jgi:integrase
VVTVERRYRYVYEDESRHGQVRLYFWRGKGHRKIRINERIGTPAFDRRYEALLKEGEAGAFKPAPRDTPKPQSLRWLGTLYLTSAEVKQLDERTRHVTKLILDSIYKEPICPGAAEVFGDCPLASFTAQSVGILRDRKKDFPEAANNRLKRLRTIFKWALAPERTHLGITMNPARDVAKLKPKRKGGFPVWRPADLDKFETAYPIGTQPRLALALLMFLGPRRSDVVRLGPPMVRAGTIAWTPHKTRNADDPVEVDITIIPELQRIIDATPVVGTTTWLVTQYGRPFTPEGFGNKMAEWCAKAGLKGLNSHGVRKAAATRMAERGGSSHALMATFGWLDIKQAERYTRTAARRKLARENAHLLGTDGDQIFPTLPPQQSQVGKKAAKT